MTQGLEEKCNINKKNLKDKLILALWDYIINLCKKIACLIIFLELL